MSLDSQQLDALFAEYEQLKEEIRTGLEVYEKIYSPLISVAAVTSGLVAVISIPDEQRGTLYALIPVMILGILGVVWYGHQIALARLSARLEVVEYRISTLLGRPELFNWESHWAMIGPRGYWGKWQRLLTILAMLPSIAIYLVTAWLSRSWWVSLLGNSICEYVPFAIYLIIIVLAFLIQIGYMHRLHSTLEGEVEKHKKIAINANINHHSNSRPGSISD